MMRLIFKVTVVDFELNDIGKVGDENKFLGQFVREYRAAVRQFDDPHEVGFPQLAKQPEPETNRCPADTYVCEQISQRQRRYVVL